MPAEIEMITLVGKPAWHGLGKLYAEGTVLTTEQVFADNELDWNVEIAPIVTNDLERTSVDDWRVSRRDKDQRILGVVKKGWTPIQNKDAFTSFDKIIKHGRAQYETAGSLRGGSKIFALAKLGDPLLLANGRDVVDRYILLNVNHDGAPSNLLFTPVRVVCQNTLNLALSPAGDDVVTRCGPRARFNHYAQPKLQLKQAESLFRKAIHYYELFGEFSKFLCSKQASSDVVETIVETVFPPNKKGEITDSIQERRDSVEHLFTEGKGHNVEGVKGSAWALLNAFAEYADHGLATMNKKVKTPSERAYSVWLGNSRGLKEKAGQVIQKVFA